MNLVHVHFLLNLSPLNATYHVTWQFRIGSGNGLGAVYESEWCHKIGPENARYALSISCICLHFPDSKVQGAKMGLIWGALLAPWTLLSGYICLSCTWYYHRKFSPGRCTFPRRGVIGISTRTSDSSWFSLPLSFKNDGTRLEQIRAKFWPH